MLKLIPLPAFTTWLEGLRDVKVRSVIAARIQRLARRLPGDVRPVSAGVSELCIHLGAGWRICQALGVRLTPEAVKPAGAIS